MFALSNRELDGFIFKEEIQQNVAERFITWQSDEHFVESDDSTGTVPPLACRFRKRGILAVADEDGAIMILNTLYTGQRSLVHDWRAHENAVFDVAWVPMEEKLVTGSGDKSLILWDITSQNALAKFKGHTSSIKSVNFLEEDKNIFASGSRDGHVMLWDIRVNSKGDSVPAVNVIRNPHAVKEVVSARRKRKTENVRDLQFGVTSVIFQDENTLISSGSCDGDIKVWDLRKTYSGMKSLPVPRDIFPYPKTSGRSFGISSLTLDSSRTRLFASCMDSVIYQYDCAAFSKPPVCTYHGIQMASFYVRLSLSPDDRFLLSGSSDSNAYIWEVQESSTPTILQGHTKEVCDVSWCPDDPCRLATTSDDCTVRIWRTDPYWKAEVRPSTIDIIGRAKRTHRDIGACTSTPTTLAPPRIGCRSTVSGLRRRLVRIAKRRLAHTPQSSPRKTPRPLFYSSPKRQSPRKLSNLSTPQSQSPRTSLMAPEPAGCSSNRADGNTSNSSTVRNVNIDATHGAPPSSKTPNRKLHGTPRKHTVPVSSPSKLSVEMKSAIESLIKNWPNEISEAKPKRRPFSMETWLKQGKQKTPRKLEITPKKNSPVPSTSALTTFDSTSSGPRRVKRKLTDCYGEDQSVSKRARVNLPNDAIETLNNQVRNEAIDQSRCVNKKTDECLNNGSVDEDSVKQDLTHLSEIDSNIIASPKTPHRSSHLCASQDYRSPTINLPNYVMKPEPRTPIARTQSKISARTPDWLSKARKNREKNTVEDGKEKVGLGEKAETPKAFKKSKSEHVKTTTPRNKRNPVQKPGSIFQYLSPSQGQKKT